MKPFLADTSCQVYLFGSRATKSAAPTSDFDIAVDAAGDIGRRLGLIRESLAQSTIPYKVDLVDLKAVSEEFRRQVNKESVLIWKN
jgi:predicted nucleotidyltransferase